MLSAQALTFRYTGQEDFLFRDLDLAIRPGRLVLIQGESGSGKSTLCRILCGVTPQVIKEEIQGDVLLDGVSIQDKPLISLSQSIGVVFQDPDPQLFMPTVEYEIVFGLENLALSPAIMTGIVNRTIQTFGLETLRHQDPRQCSGGEKQLVVFASVAAMDRPYLILDEALAQVDADRCQLIREQLSFFKQQGKGILLVDHRHLFDDLADEVVCLGGDPSPEKS
jgi:energy-coupling factor transport system ATP-binding protein